MVHQGTHRLLAISFFVSEVAGQCLALQMIMPVWCFEKQVQ